MYVIRRCVHYALLTTLKMRPRSMKNSYNSVIPARCVASVGSIFNTNKELVKFSDLPVIPSPPLPKLSLEELSAAGESVLGELGLFSWWKPTSFVRFLLEYSHIHFNLPWWTAIVCGTVVLRLALIYAPIMSQRLVAQRSKYAKEFTDFQNRISEAQKEGDSLLVQQILLEQFDFCKAKGIRNGRMFFVLFANGFIFATQYFAIKKMIDVGYPGFSTGGTLWFEDLTACDPYYALPLISSATVFLVVRSGVEFGASSSQVAPTVQVFMKYGIPVIVLICTSQFASGLCLYWCTSNVISLAFAGAFRIKTVRDFLKIPNIVPQSKQEVNRSSFSKLIQDYKEKKAAPPSLYDLSKDDLKQFKRAGQGKKHLN